MSVSAPRFCFLSCCAFLAGVSAFAGASQPPPKPKLVVAIIVDQFRYDYLTRFRGDYHGGFDQLLTRGANFTNAYYTQVPTVTAVGHSMFMSGAMPAVSGIVGNAWYERNSKQVVTSVCDWDVKTVGSDREQTRGSQCTDSDPASPKRMLVSSLGDELRAAHPDSKVIGISIKARGAILPAGHRAAGAFWFDDVTGHFVSSTYYMAQLPEWAAAFNHDKSADKYLDTKWEGFPYWSFRAPAGSKVPYSKLAASPWGNELIESFAERALIGEKLGQRGPTDLLTVSFSSNDYVGHRVGPDAPEVRDMSIRTDQLLAKLFRAIDGKVGLANAIVVLSADHGVAPIPMPTAPFADRMPGGYITADAGKILTAGLDARFGKQDWLIEQAGEAAIYFDYSAFAKAKKADGSSVTWPEIYRAAKEILLAAPDLHVSRVYSRDQLESGMTGDFIAQASTNGFYPNRSGDLDIIFEPGYVPGKSGTGHFTPYLYDRHVPILFMGPGIKAGRYDEMVKPNDIASTLATMLDVQTPSGSAGRVLTEILAH